MHFPTKVNLFINSNTKLAMNKNNSSINQDFCLSITILFACFNKKKYSVQVVGAPLNNYPGPPNG